MLINQLILLRKTHLMGSAGSKSLFRPYYVVTSVS